VWRDAVVLCRPGPRESLDMRFGKQQLQHVTATWPLSAVLSCLRLCPPPLHNSPANMKSFFCWLLPPIGPGAAPSTPPASSSISSSFLSLPLLPLFLNLLFPLFLKHNDEAHHRPEGCHHQQARRQGRLEVRRRIRREGIWRR